MKIIFVCLTILFFFTHTSVSIALQRANKENHVYPRENVVKVAGYPALTYFVLGDTHKPLVVFIPGGYNLARIAYGTPNTKQSDYLSYWIHQKGYSFLGLSYPLENSVYNSVYPAFTIKDWANQIIDSVKLQIDTHKLPKTFVMLGWSMAGKVVTQVNSMAKKKGLRMIYISLSSDPPMRGLVKSTMFDKLTSKPTALGLSSGNSLTTWFLSQIHEQSQMNGHVIINDDTYITDMMGNQPVDLLATSTRFKNKQFTQDPAATLIDTQAMDYDSYPIIGLLHDDYRSDYINALFTNFDWSPMLTRVIYNSIMQKIKLEELSLKEWDCLESLIKHLPRAMSKKIHGNHLFFLGERGAQQTVIAIQSLLEMIENINAINSPSDLCTFKITFQQ